LGRQKLNRDLIDAAIIMGNEELSLTEVERTKLMGKLSWLIKG
jgi:hypothetical protein